MINQELSSIFEDLADMEEIEGNRWESLAYRRVASSISLLTEDIMDIYRRNELRRIDGVGIATEKKIIEYIKTGKISKHRDLIEKYTIDFQSLRKIQGLGPKRIALLHLALGVKNLDELVEAVKADKVSTVPGFGKKSQESLKKSIDFFLSTGANRIPLADCYDSIQEFVEKLKLSGKFNQLQVAGSTRRMKETVGDIDILCSSNDPKGASDYFLNIGEVKHVIAKGDTKISVLLSIGLNCDLRIIDSKSFGSALQYFTGSKEHNIRLRDLAINYGMKLNEYGLFRGDSTIASITEEEVYNKLGLQWVPPELRENMGEIEAASKNELPELINYEDIRGDLHTHTDASDGHSTFGQMVEAGKAMNYEFMAITEHSKSLKVANGLDEKRFMSRNNEIDKFNESSDSIRILKGVELEILKDGVLDLSNRVLDDMEVVLGAMHQGISDDIKVNTKRLVNAINTGQLTAIAHPTGRMIGTREPYPIDFDRIFQACRDNDVAVEINGFPARSDLPYDLVKKAKTYKVNFTLGSDAHSVRQLKYLKFATAIARRGWLENKNVLNARSFSVRDLTKQTG